MNNLNRYLPKEQDYILLLFWLLLLYLVYLASPTTFSDATKPLKDIFHL